MSTLNPIILDQKQPVALTPQQPISPTDARCASLVRGVKLWGSDDISPNGCYAEAELCQDGNNHYSLILQDNEGNPRTINWVRGLPSKGDLPSQLRDTYLKIHPTGESACIQGRLRGGMMDAAAGSVFNFLFALAMQQGAAFIAGEGSEEATMVKVKLMQGEQPVEGRYTGQMARVRREGYFFRRWAPYGQGKVMIENGDWYEGLWLNGRFCNTGNYETADGRWRYEGQWRDGERLGYGKLFTQNARGQRVLAYEGGWKKDLFDGRGTFALDGKEKFGLWQKGQLIKEELTTEESEALITVPASEGLVLGDFSAKISKVEEDTIESAVGLELNRSIAQALAKVGALFSVQLAPSLDTQPPLPLGIPSVNPFLPSIEIHSFDTSLSNPFIVLPERRTVGLESLVLPKPIARTSGHLDALEWLQSYATQFEKCPPSTASSFGSWTRCSIPQQIIVVALPVDTQKGGRAEFAPLIKMPSTLPSEGATWGYIAWANNGPQSASDCVHVHAKSTIEVMTVKDKIQQSWGMQAIRSDMPGSQFTRIRDNIDQSLSNAMHFILFRYTEKPVSHSLQSAQDTVAAPATGAMVEGKHYKPDTRGTYRANVYRELDMSSLTCITVIGLPILVQTSMTPPQVQYCIKSHWDRMQELLQLQSKTIHEQEGV